MREQKLQKQKKLDCKKMKMLYNLCWNKQMIASENIIRVFEFEKQIKMSNSKDQKFIKTKPSIPPMPKRNNSTVQTSDFFLQTQEVQKKGSQHSSQDEFGIKKWKIGKLLGGGASGSVYKALNIKTGVLAAVKKIIYLNQDLEQSRNQLKILSKIHHPNVVNYIEDYQLENETETWVFMELLPSTLEQFYKSFGPPPYQNFVIFARQIVEGLHYLHKEKIVHKDLKCSNIMLDSKCTVKLSDFGCSKGFEQTISLMAYEKSGLRSFKGSAAWVAPQAIIEGKYTRKTDIWSLGCTLLQLATGKTPWHEKHFQQELQAMFYIGGKPELPQIPQNLHENILELILSCLNRNPDKRMTTQQLLKLKIFTSHSQRPNQ